MKSKFSSHSSVFVEQFLTYFGIGCIMNKLSLYFIFQVINKKG